MDGAVVSRAVALWLGWQRVAWPQRDEQRVVGHFGAEDAAEVMPLVLAWEDDFYGSDAHLSAPDLAAMGEQAASRFRSLHPEATAQAVDALAWAYTFDHK